MSPGKTHEYLVRLHDVILQEREYAKNLDIEGMTRAMGEKDELIQYLSLVQVLDEQDKPLAARIRSENRRNAFLFKSTLTWIREIMEFFGKSTVTQTYSSSAYTVPSQINGRLLSGKV
jgi:hypothetical protein